MARRKKTFYAAFLVFYITLSIQSRSCMGSVYGASFLEIGVGARAIGMGSAFCSIADDGTAFFWNPAGIGFIEKSTLSGMYGPQFGSFKNPMGSYHFIGITHPLPGNGVLGINWIRLSVDDIPIYSALDGDSYWERLHDISLRPSGEAEGYINDVEDAFFFTFALMNSFKLDLGWEYHEMEVKMPIGVNLKWIRQSLGEGEATGIGIDVGAVIVFPVSEFFEKDYLGTFRFGLNIQDITGTKIGWNTKHQDPVPTNFKWGISYSQPISDKTTYILVSYDRDSRWHGKDRFGLEFVAYGVLGLRAGSDNGNLTGGVGIRFWKIDLNYGFISHELNFLHRISCSINF